MGRYFSKILILIIIISVILSSGCVSNTQEVSESNQYIPSDENLDVQEDVLTQKITFTNDNSTSTIIKDKITKTALIETTIYYEQPSEELLANPFYNELRFNEFGTAFAAKIFQMAAFNKTAVEEFNQMVQNWNSQEFTVQDDSLNEEQSQSVKYNPLEGYEVTEIKLHIVEKKTNRKISDSIITGPSEEDLKITMY